VNESASVTVSLGHGIVYVRNLGLGDAVLSSFEATSDGRRLRSQDLEAVEIRAGQQIEVPCDTDLEPDAMARMRIAWRNTSGTSSEIERLQGRRQ